MNDKKTIKIRQATKQGFVECEVPGIADLTYPSSSTRRGRCERGGQVSPTICAEAIPSLIEFGDEKFWNFVYKIEDDYYLIRVRKLMPIETWSLMGFDKEDFRKAESVVSNTQLYRQAGNSICKNVLIALLGQLWEGKEEVYKDYGQRRDNPIADGYQHRIP